MFGGGGGGGWGGGGGGGGFSTGGGGGGGTRTASGQLFFALQVELGMASWKEGTLELRGNHCVWERLRLRTCLSNPCTPGPDVGFGGTRRR